MASTPSRLAAGVLAVSADGNYWPSHPYGTRAFAAIGNANAIGWSTATLVPQPGDWTADSGVVTADSSRPVD